MICPHKSCNHEWEFIPTKHIPVPTLCPKCLRKLTSRAVKCAENASGGFMTKQTGSSNSRSFIKKPPNNTS